jgi:hypothetical protein
VLRFILIPIACGLVGCFDNITTEFPAELVPLEENLAEFPESKDGDPYPQGLGLHDELGSRYHIVHAKGYVHAPILDVYDALRLPEVTVDSAKVDKWKAVYANDGAEECSDLPPEIEYCHRIDNEVDDIISVKFHVVWRFGAVDRGKDDSPRAVLGRWQKTWGSEVIEWLEGSVYAYPVKGDESVTAIEIIEHLDAFQGSRGNAIDFVNDYYDGIVDMTEAAP